MPQVVMTNRLGIKSVLTIPWTVDELQYGQIRQQKIQDERDAYTKVPLVFRATNLRCNNLIRVPWHVEDLAGNEIDEYPFEETLPLQDLIWKTEAALILRGANYVVTLQNSRGLDIGMQWLNPFTVVMKLLNNGEWSYYQEVNGKRYPQRKPDYWLAEEMWHVKDFNINDDVKLGTAPAAVALINTRVNHYVSMFAANFFENGAMPITMVTLPAGTEPSEVKRVENWFKRIITGIRNSWRVIGVTGETKPSILTPNIKDMDLTTIDSRTINAIAWAFDIPKTVLTADSANFATAQAEYESFIKHTIAPRALLMATRLNKRLKMYGCQLRPEPEALSEMQQDEAVRAGAFRDYVISGMSPQLAAAVLGIVIPKEFEQAWKNSAPEAMTPLLGPRQSLLAPGVTEAPKGDIAEDNPDQAVVAGDAVKAMIKDLRLWHRKASTRLTEGKSANVQFVSDSIPSSIKDGINGLLEHARSKQEVDLLFTATINHFSGASQ